MCVVLQLLSYSPGWLQDHVNACKFPLPPRLRNRRPRPSTADGVNSSLYPCSLSRGLVLATLEASEDVQGAGLLCTCSSKLCSSVKILHKATE